MTGEGEARNVTYTLPTATDDNPAPTVDCVPAPGTTFPLGPTIVTRTATDVATGQTSTGSFTVTLVQTIARTIAPMNLLLRRRPLIPQLKQERFNLYLETLAEQADREGAILEVGCFRGATTVAACHYLRRLGKPAAHYVIVDTFAGFVAEQFEQDVKLGTPESFRGGFAGNPLVLVQRTLRHYGLDEVTIVQGDIVQLEEWRLPDRIKVCLMDVDLAFRSKPGYGKSGLA